MNNREQRLAAIREAWRLHDEEDRPASGNWVREQVPWLLAEIERLEAEIAGCHSSHHPHNQKPYTPGQYKQARGAIRWQEGDE